ncbi:unnamed protein product [Rhizophagus irregularis]|nr:unnamed protein product [Rhizophagus irregularis]
MLVPNNQYRVLPLLPPPLNLYNLVINRINLSGRPNVTLPVQQTGPTITPEEVAALRQQIVELSKTIRSMDERIDWFSAQLESHEYRIAELESSVYPDANPHSSYENFESYQDNQEEHQESD